MNIRDSLGLIETNSIAAGVRAADEIMKAAHVRLLEASPISSGKFLVVFTGNVADVEASLAAGRRFAGGSLVDELLLARVHAEVGPAIERTEPVNEVGNALGVVETLSVASAIAGADAAAKAARVRVLEIAPGRGIGGKGFFTITGEVASVEAAAAAARVVIDARGYHLRTEILAGPHDVILSRVARLLMRRVEESS